MKKFPRYFRKKICAGTAVVICRTSGELESYVGGGATWEEISAEEANVFFSRNQPLEPKEVLA